MRCRIAGAVSVLGLEHDPEKACPGLDPGCPAVFGKDHAQTSPATIRLNDWRSSMEASTSLQDGAGVFLAGDGNPWVI
jgi:hypothetical protein